MKFYTNKHIVVRIFSLWVTGLIIMMLLWALSYRELPEGILREKFIVSVLDLELPNRFYIFLEIFAYNLLFVCLPIFIGNFIWVKNFPVGYLLVLYHWGLYGLFLGTNSFYFQSSIRLVPSVENLVSGVGLYEISSYTIIASSTCGLYSKKMRLSSFKNLSVQDRLGLMIGFIILFFSNLLESWKI